MPSLEKIHDDALLPEASHLEDIVHDVISQATDLGATGVEAGVSVDSGLSVTVRLGETETLEFHQDQGLGVTVYFDHRKGTASSADFSVGSIAETVQAACDIARYTSEDPYAGLADAARMAKVIPDLDLYHPWNMTAGKAIDIAAECEAAARAVDERIVNSEGATLSSHDGISVTGNSHGFMGSYKSSRHSISCAVIGKQGDEMERDSWYESARDPQDLVSAVRVGEKAGQQTISRLGARQMETCTVPVVFAAEVARGLFGHFINAISGSSLYRKSSFLLDHLGKPVFPAFIHIHEEPLLKKALGSAPYDTEGVATQTRDIVSDGILQGYVLGSYAARKLEMETTGNAGGVRNLTIDYGDKDLDALLKSMDKGLLVTDVMGFGVNILTGDYSRGVSGFWVEGGEIQYPVSEITAAGNLRDMFQNIVEVGNDVDLRGNIRSGSVLIEQMMIAGS